MKRIGKIVLVFIWSLILVGGIALGIAGLNVIWRAVLFIIHPNASTNFKIFEIAEVQFSTPGVIWVALILLLEIIGLEYMLYLFHTILRGFYRHQVLNVKSLPQYRGLIITAVALVLVQVIAILLFKMLT
ncbi:hypothetical protein JG30_03800 [Bombilactobacillus mellifer]|uniref:Uncharacterized protein n=1 Tax=Bombilactobacillus mellifer TaxID=1218492 RepID=A0A0F4LYH2_9LACO|nr:hypothetical protein [Bombilactobacillus mellifer]KJY62591.1 hypothetical protein JG30_03800 [Bombilactobacillus mellifer]